MTKTCYQVRSAVPDLPIGYIGLSLVPQDQGGLQQTVVRIEPMACIWSFRLNFVKNLCLDYDEIKFYSTFVVITPESSNEFPRISIRRLVKPHANYCVDIRKARWLRSAFAESYRLLCVTLSKELVAIHVWNAPDQWHNWRVAGVETALPPAKLNVNTGRLPSLYFGIYYSFGLSRLFFCIFRCVFRWF